MLGHAIAGHRPEARARPTAHDHRHYKHLSTHSIAIRNFNTRPPIFNRFCSGSSMRVRFLALPTILVRMNAAGPSIDRSTWLSAAKCITPSGKISLSLCGNGRKRCQVAGIAQFVDHQCTMVRFAHEVPHDCRADEAGAAGRNRLDIRNRHIGTAIQSP
jgi:hypothetical protein